MGKFVDIVTITVESGDGGPGAISFRREKYEPKGGPDGGNGGKGGNIILLAQSQLQTLMDLKLKPQLKGGDGAPGSGRKKFGSDGEDTIIKIPCGTLIKDENGHIIEDLTEHNASIIIAKGGKGGKGNACFATSRNQSPYHSQDGLAGETKTITLELQLIAEIGLIGLPNAGKSTLLNALTAANPKIGSYPFTTLFPNLGVLKYIDREIVIADIPGLIEGASEGQGLGDEFLRHISRTNLLLHLIEIPLENPNQCWDNYHTIREELKKYNPNMVEKPEMICLTKTDLHPKSTIESVKKLFQSTDNTLISLSSHSRDGIEELKKQVLHALK